MDGVEWLESFYETIEGDPRIGTTHISVYLALVYESFKKSCRGRDRTSTRQLAIAQSSVVDPGRTPALQREPALHYVCPVILTPETRGHVCQKFHHPTVYKNSACPPFKRRNVVVDKTILG
jgi:hypothetical protein